MNATQLQLNTPALDPDKWYITLPTRTAPRAVHLQYGEFATRFAAGESLSNWQPTPFPNCYVGTPKPGPEHAHVSSGHEALLLGYPIIPA